MAIRYKLRSDECLLNFKDEEWECEQLILGKCRDIALSYRSKDDPHIVMHNLIEDDGAWFISTSLGSSYWLDDQIEVMQATKGWLEENAVPHIFDGKQWDMISEVIRYHENEK